MVFSVDGHNVRHGTTNSSGAASCTMIGIVITLGPANYTASYAGDADYQPSSGNGKL